MAELWNEITEKVSNLAGKWTSYAALGSFLLYLFGYLTLRFQLSTYGVATNLDIFDEKYLFAGCRFLVYLVSAVPSILVLFLLVAAIGYVPYKLVPASFKERVGRWVSEWCAPPARLPLLGIVVAVAMIQVALRRCFGFGNLLLRKTLPEEWLSSVLLASDLRLSLYFSGLVAGTLITGAILFHVLRRGGARSAASEICAGLLVFLLAVEFLLLPVNYGVLISTQELPRVAEVGGGDKLPEGARSWLVWDSKEVLTYFVRDPSDQRMLITVPRKENKVKIIGYDDIFCELFSANHAGPRPCPR
jgi:hypothetical protein